MSVTVIDYGAGNVRSVCNAIRELGFAVEMATTPAQIASAAVVVFPGVGSFGRAMAKLDGAGMSDAIRAFCRSGRPFMGVCLGQQLLFESSQESPGVAGLGVFRGAVIKFEGEEMPAVPQMGWNGVHWTKESSLAAGSHGDDRDKYYFVHSFYVPLSAATEGVALCTTDYGGVRYVSAVQQGNVVATQFHPEKSGKRGLAILQGFLSDAFGSGTLTEGPARAVSESKTKFARRIIACLDVRSNDAGDLVVTKGDQYDVREKQTGGVRNLGKPVELARRYYEDGADEVTFLNITSFRNFPLQDLPMIEVLRQTSEHVFVPLTIGGGIRNFEDAAGKKYSALDVADAYFRSGADKVSIGGDAVAAAEAYYANGCAGTGESSIEQISHVYGAQAVVISIDPKRVYVDSADAVRHHTTRATIPGPNGETLCWYQCTIKGGREARDIGAYEVCKACEALGAGEILLNCMDQDGTNAGYDIGFIRDIKQAVGIPVIASSGAGKVEHFSAVFAETNADAALAAGIFHRKEIEIADVKAHLEREGAVVRQA